MNLDDFVSAFADLFDETELSEFTPATRFRELEEWSSLIGLATMNMIAKKIGVQITAVELRGAQTIEDIYHLIQAKR